MGAQANSFMTLSKPMTHKKSLLQEQALVAS
jgi:hypothetical protein